MPDRAPLAETRAVERRFGDELAVAGVDLAVHRGEVVGLLGANGAGKTTLVRMLLGLLAPTAGTALLFGAPPDRTSRTRLGYVPQGLGLYDDLTVHENLAFVAAAFHTAPETPTAAQGAGGIVGSLPLGRRRRAAFAAALLHKPELLLLDEPTSGVDPLGRARLWDTVHDAAERGAGVLVTTHYLSEAEQCDRLVVLAAGSSVAAGTPAEIVADRTTVRVRTLTWDRAFDVIDQERLPVALAGPELRVPGGDADRIARLLADAAVTADTEVGPATLEETFVLLTEEHA